MEQKLKQKMQEKIKNKAVLVGMNATVRAAKKSEVDCIIYASNISQDMLTELNKLKTPLFEYEGDSETLSIACGKSFNISVLGLKK